MGDEKEILLAPKKSAVEATASQTDASEWVEYETDMKELYKTLKDEGIDIPLNDKGQPMITPQFMKNLPPSVQPHAGGKKYAGGKPFQTTLSEKPPKGTLGREIQTRRSGWEDYHNELKKLYAILQKKGVEVPRDEDGVPFLTEEFIKSLPADLAPHPAGAEFSPIPGVPPMPDGTRVSPRLTIKLLNPALQGELVRRLTKKGIKIPMKDGNPVISPEFIQTVPAAIITKVLEPVYESQKRVSESRKSAIRKFSMQEKQSLADVLKQHGVEVKTGEDGEPEIPESLILDLSETEISEAVGPDRLRDILKPGPRKQSILPQDHIPSLTDEQRDQIGDLLRDEGISVDVDINNVPIITRKSAKMLPKDTLEFFGITLEEEPDEGEIAEPRKHTIVAFKNEEPVAAVANKDEPSSEEKKSKRASHDFRKSRKQLQTGRGLYRLTRKKDLLEKLSFQLEAAGVEIKMTDEGGLDLTHAPDDIVNEFTLAVQDEIRDLDVQTLHERIHAMAEEDRKLIHEHLEIAGISLPTDHKGNKVITVELLQNIPRDVLINLLAKTFAAIHYGRSEDEEEEEEEEEEEMLVEDDEPEPDDGSSKILIEGEYYPDDDWELDLTDAQLEEFSGKLMEEGITVPIDTKTGRWKITRHFVRNVPKKLLREMIVQAPNALGRRESLSSGSSKGSLVDVVKKVKPAEPAKPIVPQNVVLGLRYSNGVAYVADDKGQKLDYENLLKYLDNAYSETEIKKHDVTMIEQLELLNALIREGRLHEDEDPDIKRTGSLAEMQKMAMRYIPAQTMTPGKDDPIHLFDSTKPDAERWAESYLPSHHKVEFVPIMEPKGMPSGREDSLADIASTVARRLSNETVRGSNLSTHLSDMPSTFSQALIDEPSVIFATASSQSLEITPWTVADYREKWLTSFMSGFTPRQTFTLRITNMITRKQIELRVCKHNTINEVCHLYMQYENHPEYYVWKDIYGRVLCPEKTLVENGLVRQDEVLEFQGFRRLPVILLYFRDGFESDPPLPLNPLHALRQKEPGLCRNY